MNVCQKNAARFAHVESMFDKINDIFQGFGSLVSLRPHKDRHAQSKFGRTYRTGTQTAYALFVRIYNFFFQSLTSFWERSAFKTAVIYYYITTEFHYAKRDPAYGGIQYGEKR